MTTQASLDHPAGGPRERAPHRGPSRPPHPGAAGSDGAAARPPSGGRVRWLAASDLAAMLLSVAIALAVAQQLAPPAVLGPPGVAAALALAQGPVWLATFAGHRLYERESRALATGALDEVGDLAHALLVGCLVLLLAGQVLARFAGVSTITPVEAGLLLPVALVLVPLGRAVVRGVLLPAVAPVRRAVVVGAGPAGQAVAARLARRPSLGMELVGFVDDGTLADVGGAPAGTRVLGRPADLTRIVEEHRVDWVVVASAHTAHGPVLDAIRAVRRPDVHLSIVPHHHEVLASNAQLEDVEGLSLVTLPPIGLSRTAAATKRALDVGIAGAGLVLLAPLLLAVGVAVRLGSPGPALFRQERRGRAGTTFRILKFRTMVDGAEAARAAVAHLNEADGPLLKIRADPRVTRVGAALRRRRLDELPQLLNVLRGEMSLVGPRPFVCAEADAMTAWAQRRLELRPGMTGLWQVLGGSALPHDELTKLDFVYVTSWSLGGDVRILLRTVPVALLGRGAW